MKNNFQLFPTSPSAKFRSKIESVLDIFIFPSLTNIVLDYSHIQKFSKYFIDELKFIINDLIFTNFDYSVVDSLTYFVHKNNYTKTYSIYVTHICDDPYTIIDKGIREYLKFTKDTRDSIDKLGKCVVTNRCYMNY